MKRRDLFPLEQMLSQLAESAKTKFSFAIHKNMKLIKAETDSVREINKPVDGMRNFDIDRLALCEEMADKMEDGKAKIENNAYVIADMAAFEAKLLIVKEKHAEAIKQQQAKEAALQVILDEEVEINLHKILVDDLPDNLTVAQINVLESIIRE